MTAETDITIPNTKHPFFITVDASLVSSGAVLFQMNKENKMRVISYNLRILNTQEQNLSTLDRELLAKVYALQIYEFLLIGSPHPIYIFTDHKPLLHCFAKKGNLSKKFYRAQMQLTNFSKLKFIQNPGKNLTVADMLSRTFTKEQLQIHQLRHKQLPPQIDFSIMKDDQIKPVHYLVKHEEIKYNQNMIQSIYTNSIYTTSIYTNSTRYIHQYFSFNPRTYETFLRFTPFLHPNLQQREARLTFAIGENLKIILVNKDHGIIDAWYIYNIL